MRRRGSGQVPGGADAYSRPVPDERPVRAERVGSPSLGSDGSCMPSPWRIQGGWRLAARLALTLVADVGHLDMIKVLWPNHSTGVGFRPGPVCPAVRPLTSGFRSRPPGPSRTGATAHAAEMIIRAAASHGKGRSALGGTPPAKDLALPRISSASRTASGALHRHKPWLRAVDDVPSGSGI